jgi:Tfp pilus assembly protein PilF
VRSLATLKWGAAMPSENLTARMHFDQGRQAFARREYDTAADNFRNAVTTDPRFNEAHRYLAETYEKLGYGTRAKRAWEALLRMTTDAAQQREINQRIAAL